MYQCVAHDPFREKREMGKEGIFPNLAPLRSEIGMMEFWNIGIVGSGLRPAGPPARRG
jgi:hypothetical protein